MTTSFTSRNQANVIPEVQINSRLVVQPGVHYTCPADKKSIFTGTVQCTGLGAASFAALRDPSNTFNLAEWRVGGLSSSDFLLSLAVGMAPKMEIELTAGQTITTTQDAGTNAEMNVIGKILELPA